MNPTELILNFVNLYNHPFTADLAAEMTAQETSLVVPILESLHSDQTIKLISPEDGIYVRSNRFNPVVGYKQKSEWRFDPAAATVLLDHIEKGRYHSIRGVAKGFPRSRQWVFVYMEALASMGILDYDGCYKVITRDNLTDIGKTVKKGALSDLGNRLMPVPRTYEPVPGEDEETHLRRLAEARERIAAFEKCKLNI